MSRERAEAIEVVLDKLVEAWCAMKIPNELTPIVGSDKNAVVRAGRLIDQLDRTIARHRRPSLCMDGRSSCPVDCDTGPLPSCWRPT